MEPVPRLSTILLIAILFGAPEVMASEKTAAGNSASSISKLNNDALSRDSDQNQTSTFFLEMPKFLIAFMDKEQVVTFNYSIACNYPGEQFEVSLTSSSETIFSLPKNDVYIVRCPDFHSDMNLFLNKTKYHSVSDSGDVHNSLFRADGSLNMTMKGNLLGMASLVITASSLTPSLSANIMENTTAAAPMVRVFPVSVMRSLRPIDIIFRYVITAFIVVVTIGFGCKLDLGIVKECIKKPAAPLIGLCCQYLGMPLLGFLIAKVLPAEDRSLALGVFLCGICPGGGASNIYTFLLDGDVSLSITMTFISTVASIGFIPAYAYTLGSLLMDDEFTITIPYINLLQICAMVTIPLFIGIAIKWKIPKAAIVVMKVLRPVLVVCVLVLMVVGLYSNLYIFRVFQPQHFIAGCSLPYMGYILGGSVAAIAGQPFSRVKTIALETGMQNGAVAFMIVMLSFPPPFGDLAAAGPVASSMMTPIPPFFVTIVYLVYKRCTRQYDPVRDDIDVEVKVKSSSKKNDVHRKDETIIIEKLSAV